MALDPGTLLVAMNLVILVTGMNYAVIWLQDRRQTALLWMTVTTLLAALFLALRMVLPPALGITFGNAGILLAVGCVWMACRSIDGRRSSYWMLGVPPLIWIALCLVPGFLSAGGVRAATANFMAMPSFGLAAWEIWRLEGRRVFVRWWVAGVLAARALACLGWGLFNLMTVAGTAPQLESINGFALAAFFSTALVLLMSFGLVVLVKDRSEHAVRQEAMLDTLTGLANRRCFNEALAESFRQALRDHHSVSVVMIDVDSFKAYNDLYGHVEGDTCLRAIGMALRSGLVRRGDFIARYGGEEFVVLLPATNARDAARIAERLCRVIRDLKLAHAGCDRGVVTISAGVAALFPADAAEDPTDLLRAADRSLYRAKQLGRDRSHLCEEGRLDPTPLPA